jgi:hypothetical protein
MSGSEATAYLVPLQPVCDPMRHLPFDSISKLFYDGFSDDSLARQINIRKYPLVMPEYPVIPVFSMNIDRYQGQHVTDSGSCPRPACEANISDA